LNGVALGEGAGLGESERRREEAAMATMRKIVGVTTGLYKEINSGFPVRPAVLSVVLRAYGRGA
jgi:hypothetical protein